VKVTFLEDVTRVARVGQTKEVADGYARNYLLPRKLAVIADSRAAAAVEGQLKKKIKQREIEDAEMAALAKIIEGTEVIIKAKVGENEKLYGSVTAADVAEALTKAAGREIDKKKVELLEPVRQTGVYAVTIRLAHEITATIKVKVASEEATEEQIAAMVPPAEKPAAEKPEKPAKKPRQKKAEAAEGAEVVAGTEGAEKPARKPKAEKPVAAEVTETAEAVEKPARKPKAEKAEAAEGAEKPARKPKAEKAEAAEGAEKPAKKPKAKSTKKAKGEAAEAAAPEAEEKPSGE